MHKGCLMVAIGVLLVGTFYILMLFNGGRISSIYDHESSCCCEFPAIYIFGDSNSHTGSVSSVFRTLASPYGMTHFHKPAGRYSDGRLIIDFMGTKLVGANLVFRLVGANLVLPYLSSYLDSIGTNFRHGPNFAASGCTIQPADSLMLNRTYNPLTLDVQLLQFEQLKKRTSDLYSEAISNKVKSRLPRSEDYTRSLYTIDIGQNDLDAGIKSIKEEEVKTYIPTIITEFASAVEKLYQGARKFWIHNTGPIGCLSKFVKTYPPAPNNTDEIGCVKSYNELAQVFNKQLKDKVSQLRTQLEEASFVYVDMYLVKYSLISEANEHGFTDPPGQCLGQDGDNNKACANPSEYINWDGVHYTESANKWIAKRLQDGSVSTPKISLAEACKLSG